MRKWLLSALGLIGMLLVFGVSGQVGRIVGRTAIEGVQAVNLNNSIADAQRQAAVEARKRLPLRLDQATSLTTVTSEGPTLVYGYEVDSNYDIPDAAKLKELVKSQICTDSSMQTSMGLGANYRYEYRRVTGVLLTQFTLNEANC